MRFGNPAWHRVLNHRHGGAAVLAALFVACSLATRLALTLRMLGELDADPVELAGVFGWGLLYDGIAASFFVLPAVAYLGVLPRRWFRSRVHRVLCQAYAFAVLYGLLFASAAEWVFWGEFGGRFNFIAVDYLVYTNEVLGVIYESFPVPLVLGGVFVVAAGVFIALQRTGWFEIWFRSDSAARSRRLTGAGLLVLPFALSSAIDARSLPEFANHYEEQLARNGPYELFAAFRDNELPYREFYPTIDSDEALRRLHAKLEADGSRLGDPGSADTLRRIHRDGDEKRYNIVQITVESLSAKFLGVFGNDRGLTPNLDALAREGMLFTHFYATGNRTVRGMEALTLSIPPSPGRSLVKRPDNDHLFTLGSVLRSRGYDTAFLYGGYGYFDNMSAFFGGNGYRVVDRAGVPADEITFANIWGAADEDLFRWSLADADRSHAAGRPFFQFVMTTSNHRPFTYPDGRIDIPSHGGRDGGVKYTDWAIGEYFRQARSRPWFGDTIFVIVADHCAGTRGRTEIPVERYQIPLIIYNPKLFEPRRIETRSSQIDVAPTLLGLLNWSYRTRFFGRDILRMQPADGRALIATYQSLGYFAGDQLVVLKPVRVAESFRYDAVSHATTPDVAAVELLHDAIAYYQTAARLTEQRRLRDLDDGA